MNDDPITENIIGAAIEVHRQLGPGLLESTYERCLAKEFDLRKIQYERQKLCPCLLRCRRGLLLNFNVPVLKTGIKRLSL